MPRRPTVEKSDPEACREAKEHKVTAEELPRDGRSDIVNERPRESLPKLGGAQEAGRERGNPNEREPQPGVVLS